jgi:tRNA pseudouridine38-40 synthase
MRGSMTRTLKLIVAYDGAGYVGWQRQANGTSIQGLIEDAIARIEGHEVTLTGAGRTDAGVHALGQVASVRISSTITCESYVRALNGLLPDDIRVRRVDDVPLAFHARFDVRAKTYRYRLLNAQIASPYDARNSWHETYPLDVEAMRAALGLCLGEHDFAAFQATGSSIRDTVRTMHAARITQAASGDAWPSLHEDGEDGEKGNASRVLAISVTGDGFLRHMVRTMVGTLVEVGRGRWPPAELGRILASQDRSQAGPTAPPQGLFLVDVAY